MSKVGSTPTRYGSPRYGSVRYGSPRYGSVRYGSLRYGSVRYGSLRYGSGMYCPLKWLVKGSDRRIASGRFYVDF
jgi:hypothetical protein